MTRRRDVTDIEILLLIERVDKMSQATDDLTIAVQNLATQVTAAVAELNRLSGIASAPPVDAPVVTDLATQVTAQTAALASALAAAQTAVPVTA